MKDYVLDANAVLSFLYGGTHENAMRVQRVIRDAHAGIAKVLISAINLGEVFYILRKTSPEDIARRSVSALAGIATIIEIDSETALEAAKLKYRYKLGYADSVAALLALDRKATLVSADPAFEKLGSRLKWLRQLPHSKRP